jgi:hypothetical protein
MALKPRFVIGTGGFSVWRSDDLGETWSRPYAEDGIYPEAKVWAVVSDRTESERLFAGIDSGIYTYHDKEKRWEHLPSALDKTPVWSIAQSPHDEQLFIAGTQFPAALFVSREPQWQDHDMVRVGVS